MSALLSTLQAALPNLEIISGADIGARATSYWNAAPTVAQAIVLPRTTKDVSEILKICHATGQSVVTQGGLTGVVQGAEATKDDLIISLERMNKVEVIDKVGGTATVEAGAVLESVQQQIAEQGLLFPLDLGARGSCTIGGNVATNAGGINVIRYGMMRELVLGVEAVLADGTILSSMNQMLKNNAGYDLKQLFIGTEGTLGIVTRVVLRLFSSPITNHSAMVAMADFAAVTDFLRHCQTQLGNDLSAYEVMWRDYYRIVTEEGGHRPPLARDYPFYVVLTAEGSDPDRDGDRFEALLGDALEAERIVDAVIPQSDREVREIWDVREDFSAILEDPPFFLYDVSLPIADMSAYVAGVEQAVARTWPNGAVYTLGHIGDGNLHFFVRPNAGDVDHAQVDALVYDGLKPIGGSISAEHGIGLEKPAWLNVSRSDAEIQTMKQLKRAFDPGNILNPGRVVDIAP